MTITSKHLTTAVAITIAIAVAGTVVAFASPSSRPGRQGTGQHHTDPARSASQLPVQAGSPAVSPVMDFSAVRWMS
jgi:hypothetical protein